MSLASVPRLSLPLNVTLPLSDRALFATAFEATPLTVPLLYAPPSDLFIDLSPLLINCSFLKPLLLTHCSRELACKPAVQSRTQQPSWDTESVGLSKHLVPSSSHLFLDLRGPGKLSPELADAADA